MGWRYRKSIDLGLGFRVNISKSGIGYSWGVPGYRITKTANGRVRSTVSIRGTGLSYTEDHGGSPSSRPSHNSSNQSNMHSIESAPIEQLSDATFNDVETAISKSLRLNLAGNLLIIIGILGIGFPAFAITSWIAAFVCKLLARKRYSVYLEYKFEDGMDDSYQRRMQSWEDIFSSEKVWQLTQRGSANARRNAGATTVVHRNLLRKPTNKAFWLNTNITPFVVKLQKETLVILPDKLLLISNCKVAALSLDDIHMDIDQRRFVEDTKVPSDAQIVGQTWKYVNQNGTPDRRFKNNRQLPICLYGEIVMTSDSGLNIQLQCSSVSKLPYCK